MRVSAKSGRQHPADKMTAGVVIGWEPMQASRLLSILMQLQARGRASARELALALEVSERTILRDIDQLSAAGVPVWAERGRYGGFRLREGWSTRLTGLTAEEVDALFLAGLPGPATELGLGAAAASAQAKLIAGLPPEWREQAERVRARLHVDPHDWYRAADTPHFLREVAAAVWNGRALHLRYESWRGVGERHLEPLGLVLKAGAWYLVARAAGEVGEARIGTYRLASIRALHVTSRGFRRPRGFDLAVFWAASTTRFEAGLAQLRVDVRLSPRAMAWLRNERIRWVPADRPVRRNGWTDAVLWMESAEHAARQLLGRCDEIRVLGPATVQSRMRRLAKRALATGG